LRALFAQALRLRSAPLADEGSLAHAGRIRLRHADDLVQTPRGHARAREGVGGQGVRRGRVWEDAAVYVAQGAELRLKEYPPAGGRELAQRAARVAQVGQQGLRVVPEPGPELRRRGRRRAVEPAQAEPLPLEQGLQLLLQALRKAEVPGAQDLLAVFV